MPDTQLQTIKAHVGIFADEAGQKAIRRTSEGTVIRFMASDVAEDRDQESIDPNGWEIPGGTISVLVDHDYRVEKVIGRIVGSEVVNGQFMLDVLFADNVEENALARFVVAMLGAGFLGPCSVGFLPKEWIGADGVHQSRESYGGYMGAEPKRRYIRQELLELSIVVVGSHRGAHALRSYLKSFLSDGATADSGQQSGLERLTASEANPSSVPGTTATHDAPESWFAKRFSTVQPDAETAGADLSRAYLDRLTKGSAERADA